MDIAEKDSIILNTIDEEIKYLKDKKLEIVNEYDVKKYIENYGFSRLFLALAKSFTDQKTRLFKADINEYSFLSLFYFDSDLANIFSLYIGYFEHRLNANIVAQINSECPNLDKQFNTYLKRSKREMVKQQIKIACAEEANSYLLPYRKKGIYPAEIFINFLTLGDKQYLLLDFKKTDSIIPENFNLKDFTEFNLIANIIRKFRNNANHYSKLIRFSIILKPEEESILEEIFKRNFKTNTPELWEDFKVLFLSNKTGKYNSFFLAVILIISLGKTQAENLVSDLKEFIEKSIKEITKFNVEEFLYDSICFNWPQNWWKILTKIVILKKQAILRAPTPQ